MKKQNKLLILLATALIALSSSSFVLAKEGGKKENRSDKSTVEIKIKNEIGNEDENEIEENHQTQKVKTQNNRFEIRGTITAVVENNFMVAGQTIFLDPAQVNKFKQKGILEVNKRVKVEGVIKNGVKFAADINIIGEGQGRFKFEIEDAPHLPTSSLTLSPTPSASPTSSPSASPSVTPQASTPANIKVKIKAIGTIDQVSAFLQQILNFLKSLA